MAGYQLVHRANFPQLASAKAEPAPEKIGFLDFLRELQNDSLPFPKFAKLKVVGLEEVLFAARQDREALGRRIRGLLSAAAQDLEKKLPIIYILLKGKIVRGDLLRSEYRNAEMPLGLIFGNPLRHEDANGVEYYPVNFNLTSA